MKQLFRLSLLLATSGLFGATGLPPTVKTTRPVTMELTRTKGSVGIPAGEELEVVSNEGGKLTVLFHRIPGRVPVDATDFAAAVAAAAGVEAAASSPAAVSPSAPAGTTAPAADAAALLPLPDKPLEMPTQETILGWLQTRKFDQLEKLAARIRERKLAFYRGYSPMTALYSAVSVFDEDVDDSRWENVRTLLEQWVAAYPDSAAARTCAAEFYIRYGWKARGGGYADSVTDEGWQLMEERLTLARRHLEHAARLPKPDPGTFRAMINVALGLGLSHGYVEAAFKRGIEIEPNYQPLYEAVAYYLLPRWYGADGEWEAFAKTAADQRGGEEGDILYMAIARSVWFTLGDQFFKETRISYPRMKRGFTAAMHRNPTFLPDINSFCLFACLARDRSTARARFARIGPQWDKGVWQTEENFNHWSAWAR